MLKSTYHISKMDCPSEENLIRMKLGDIDTIQKLEFQIEARILTVYHDKDVAEIYEQLQELKLGAEKREMIEVDASVLIKDQGRQHRLLWAVLTINLTFFVIELSTGLFSESMGLVADSLDMMADAVVYALALWAVGASAGRKRRVATLSGYFQIALAIIGLVEVIRRFLGFEAMPDFRIMIGISFLALIANALCLYLLQKSRSQEAHMKASMIFTSNDIIINTGVILAGILVLLTSSHIPDLLVGSFVFLIVIRGAVRILKLG